MDNELKEREMMAQLDTMREQDETLWKHKSRINWLKEGEMNNAFFHHSVT